MKLLCCFSSPELTEPLPAVARPDEHRSQAQTTSSTYIVPENVKGTSDLLHQQDSELTNDQSATEIAAPERSRHKSTMSSPQEVYDNSDEELRTTGKSTAQWKDEEKEKDKEKNASQSGPPGEEWRRWKDNPANKDYIILNTLGRGAFADVRPPLATPALLRCSCTGGLAPAVPLPDRARASTCAVSSRASLRRCAVALLAGIGLLPVHTTVSLATRSCCELAAAQRRYEPERGARVVRKSTLASLLVHTQGCSVLHAHADRPAATLLQLVHQQLPPPALMPPSPL